MGELLLVTGGSRSGKSRFAQKLIEQGEAGRTFLATCPRLSDDQELVARIDRHRADRAGRGWQSVEEERELCAAIAAIPGDHDLLIDCMALWCNNLMYAAELAGSEFGEDAAAAAGAALAAACRARPGRSVLVTNEVGLGVIPANAVSRCFVDCLGRINQALAGAATTVVLCTCGIPVTIKGTLP